MAVQINSEGIPRSPGEEIVYDFIRENLSDAFKVWMNLELSTTSPATGVHQIELDLVLFHRRLGLLLGEIKDWRAEQIDEISKHAILLKSGRQEANPSAALRKKFYSVHSILAAHREFCEGPRRVRMPINTLVWFPFITGDDWDALFKSWRINTANVGLPKDMLLFADDLVPGGALADGAAAVRRFGQARSVTFRVSLPDTSIENLDNTLRGYVSEPVPKIVILRGSEIRDSVIDLQRRGGQNQQGARQLLDILADPARRVSELLQLPNQIEPNIRNSVIYSMNPVVGVMTIHHEGVIYPVFCGNPPEIQKWSLQNTGMAVAVDRSTGRISLTRAAEPEKPPALNSGLTITSENVPLFCRVSDFNLDDLNLKRIEVRFLERVDEQTELCDIEEVLAEVADGTVAALLGNMVSLLRQGRTEAAQAAYDLYRRRAVDAADAPALESEALGSDANSDVICLIDDLPPEHVKALFSPDRFEEWMLFLHPSQKEVVDFDTERPMLITGVSGSGKTCILVHRARRLAQENPDARIFILTLNRSLAALIDELKCRLCNTAEQQRVRVCAYYDLFKAILREVGADEYFSIYDEALTDSDPMHTALRQADPRACVNDFDPRSGETIWNTWEDFLDLRSAPLQEAKHRLFSYLREEQFSIDEEGYVKDEFQLIRTTFPIEARERYQDFEREGRAIRFLDTANRPNRRDVLYLLKRYEEYMIHGGMLDEEGLTQILMCRPIREKLARLPAELRIDHLLVDEFQDFSTIELNMLRQLPMAPRNAFCAAGDPTQKVLVKQLKMMGAALVEGSAQIFRIRKNFRNSRQILLAASKLSAHYGEMAKKQGVDIEVLDPEFAVRETAPPIACKADHEVSVAWELAHEWVEGQEVKPWSVCIATAAPRRIAVESILGMCPPEVLADKLTGDYMRKQNRMVVGTIAEVKGFEFSMIVILGCSARMFPNPGRPESEAWRDALRLYVAMTRGRDQVVLTYSDEPSVCLQLMGENLSWQERNAERTFPRPEKGITTPRTTKPNSARKVPSDSVFDLKKYGLTSDMAARLDAAGYASISSLRHATDRQLFKIRNLGKKHLALIRSVLEKHQCETGAEGSGLKIQDCVAVASHKGPFSEDRG